MKSGFYLSPCGKHIVEIIDDVNGMVPLQFGEDYFEAWRYLCQSRVSIFMSCWHYLGE